MKLFIIILLSFNCGSFFSYAQIPKKPANNLEIFKGRLNKYFEKHHRQYDYQKIKNFPDTTQYNMPTGNLKSYMIDEEIGLAIEFATKKLYDKETGMIYYMKTNKIYDPKKKKFYDYCLPKNNLDQ